jgi:hypothetical protein
VGCAGVWAGGGGGAGSGVGGGGGGGVGVGVRLCYFLLELRRHRRIL